MTTPANKRIDAGIKRGPRQPSQAIAHTKRDFILESLRSGSMVKDVAQSLGVSGEAISQQLANDPEYRAAREKGIAQRLEAHYEEIQAAEDPLSLARGREAWKAATWFAEREFPARWGQHIHSTVEHVGDLAERLRRARERVIDAAPAIEEKPMESIAPPNPADA